MTASEAPPAGVRLTAGLGVTSSPWTERVRFQRQTLIARLCDRLGEPLMLRLPPPKTFASLARQFETRRCLMQFWNLNL